MSKSFTKINKKDLFEELHSAIEADRMYWIRNDAKLRAVNAVKTYDEFRDIVDAAHLTPLSRNDMAKKMQIWNTAVHNRSNSEKE